MNTARCDSGRALVVPTEVDLKHLSLSLSGQVDLMDRHIADGSARALGKDAPAPVFTQTASVIPASRTGRSASLYDLLRWCYGRKTLDHVKEVRTNKDPDGYLAGSNELEGEDGSRKSEYRAPINIFLSALSNPDNRRMATST